METIVSCLRYKQLSSSTNCVSRIYDWNCPSNSFLEYVGCYKDSDPRDLPQRVHDREVTVKTCTKSCRNLFYRYAGLQFSYLCFCGNKRGRYGQLPDWKCSSECTNKEDTHCGGYWSNSIYRTGTTLSTSIVGMQRVQRVIQLYLSLFMHQVLVVLYLYN